MMQREVTAKELRKDVRRLQQLQKCRPLDDAQKAQLVSLEARYEVQRQHEKDVMDVKGQITIAKKRKVGGAELEQLQARYKELTGEERYTKAKKEQEPVEAAPGPETFEPWSQRDFFRFEVVHESTKSRARAGVLHTPHGQILTPCFVPVGTNAALKAVDSDQAEKAGVQLMFCNTYHLLVHPGADVVAEAGGLHSFMRRTKPIITDSGGFQVFSLADSDSDEDGPELKSKRKRRDEGNGQLLEVSERGTLFRSYLDGSTIELTPESSVHAQKMLGADIIIPLDELPPYHVTPTRLEASVELSHRWMARSLRAHLADKRQQAMYAVVHGGVDRRLRKRSADYLASLPFDGFAVGGSLGKDKSEMFDLLQWLMPHLPRDKPNHVLGIADPESALALVPLGVDTMDSCNPTRIARHGSLMTTKGILKIKGTNNARDFGPIDPDVPTVDYTRAYLHHLFKQNEPLALSIASIHNILYMNHLMADMRAKILRDEL